MIRPIDKFNSLLLRKVHVHKEVVYLPKGRESYISNHLTMSRHHKRFFFSFSKQKVPLHDLAM